MDKEEIEKNVEQAVKLLLDKDNWLLKKDLSERSISHKLAEYLQPLFKDYNVDCEYNGDIDREIPGEKELGRKRMTSLRQDLMQYNLLTEREIATETEKELIERLVYPDIIIHKRGTNKHNLCIIEVKKSTSQVSFHYDQIKLKAYTTNSYGNLNYQVGYFIKFVTGSENYDYLMREFIGGNGPELE